VSSQAADVIEAKLRSALLCATFEARNAKILFVQWDGQMDSLPIDHTVLVDAYVLTVQGRGQDPEALRELIEFCNRHGHLMFQGQKVFENGTVHFTTDLVRQAAVDFLDRYNGS
jgi:hypothetical protein